MYFSLSYHRLSGLFFNYTLRIFLYIEEIQAVPTEGWVWCITVIKGLWVFLLQFQFYFQNCYTPTPCYSS